MLRAARLADGTYTGLRENFRWDVAPAFNIGVACCDRQSPGAAALVEVPSTGDERTFTFGDVRTLSNRLANALAGRGIRAGDRVGIVVPQSIEAAVAHLATYKLGAVALPLSILFGPDALSFRLQDAGARAVIVGAKTLPKLEGIRDDLRDLQTIIVVGSEDRLPPDPRIGAFDEAVASASADFSAAATAADDPALLIYTSGTTGPPKGALHAHRVLLGHLPGFELSHEFFPQEGDRFWTPADWAWIGGLLDALLPSWFHGAPVVAAARERFDPEWALKVVEDQRIRNAFLPPTALKLMRAASPGAHVKLRSVGSGGESLGEEILEWGREALGVTVNEFYGQTEVNLVVGNCSSAWEVRPGSMGRPYPGHDVDVIDESGEPVGDGEPGEIAVRAPDPVMFLGYWDRPRATEQKFTGSWVRTGDMAIRDDAGYLWFQGRGDDIINSAGYRIGPGEIEGCLVAHDAVAIAAAIGVPDETRGEVVKAFVVLRPGVDPSPDLERRIREHVKQRLAAYEYPRQIEFVDELPMTTTGKIQRAELRKREIETG